MAEIEKRRRVDKTKDGKQNVTRKQRKEERRRGRKSGGRDNDVK